VKNKIIISSSILKDWSLRSDGGYFLTIKYILEKALIILRFNEVRLVSNIHFDK